MIRPYVIKGNNAGLVVTTGGATGDLVHTHPAGKTLIMTKIMWSNHMGVNDVLVFGSRVNAGIFFPLYPAITCLTGFTGVVSNIELPRIEIAVDTTALTGLDGNIYVMSTQVGLMVRIEVEEIGA
jgi:hypothetical protein